MESEVHRSSEALLPAPSSEAEAGLRRTARLLDGDWTVHPGRTGRRVLAYALTVGALAVAYGLLQGSVWQTDAQFHTLLEVTATTLAVAVGTVASMRFYSRRENAMLFVGAAFLGTALLDGYHAVVTSTYFSEAFPSDLGSLIPWSWVASRVFLSFFLLLSWLIWWTGRSAVSKRRSSPRLVYVVGGIAVAGSFALFAFVPLPQAQYSNLPFSRPQELVPAAFLLLALIGYLHKGYWRSSTFAHWLVLSLIVGLIGQASFMSRSDEIFDGAFDAAHGLKIISYAFVLTGLFISIFQLFQRAGTYASDLAVQAAKLEEARDTAIEAVEARSQFLANVSHEIRTPMNAILGMTELALSTELSVEQREYLGTTRTSVESLIRIVNDLLDLSKIEAEKLELDSIPFSLRDTVSDTVRALSVSASNKGVGLFWEMPDSIPDSVTGDPGRLRQVLVNLIGNAIKFTPDGLVNVIVELDHLSDEDLVLHFEVRDTGIGIPPEKLGNIFEAFSQADASTTRRFGGTGLGLAISSQLVELMDGSMWAESVVGVGSRIHFTTRLALFDDVQRVVPEGRPGENPPVVVLGSDMADHGNLVEMLTQGHIQPILVTSVEEAAEEVLASRSVQAPRVLLIDNADGSLDRCERVMSDKSLSRMFVIALVSVGRRGDAREFRRLGMSGYLTKPVLQTDLLEAVGTFASDHGSKDAFVTVHTLREARPRLRVLLADDSPTNRQLAVRLLELRGHSVVTVENGVLALEAWQRGGLDVILMDVQMPEMDGIEATAAIREREVDGAHIPIVALTAFATDSDRERCLAAGLDGYVSKPFRAEQLYAAIEHFRDAPLNAHSFSGTDSVGPDPIDYAEALEIVGGSKELFVDIAGMFLVEYPGLMDAIDEACSTDDIGAVERAAHRLKGSLGMLAAFPAERAARRLEQRAASGEMNQVRRAWEALQAEMERLDPELASLSSSDSLASG